MKSRFFVILTLILLLTTAVLIAVVVSNTEDYHLNSVAVNDMAMVAKEESGDYRKLISVADDYNCNIEVFDVQKNKIDVGGSFADTLSEAYSRRDTIVTLDNDGEIQGYLVIENNQQEILQAQRTKMIIAIIIIDGIMVLLSLGYAIYLNKFVIKPFDKLKAFASSVASGNLDVPLEMDRKNLFGAFTESFDLMREELAIARKKEWEANQSKKELVASLSHDIKTPVASIKATAELLEVLSEDKKMKAKLYAIEEKADKIELLINNLFNSTLEELGELQVSSQEESSKLITELILSADYSGLVKPFTIPECLVRFDKLRLGQVFDNLISNSYKYANTEITVTSEIEGEFFTVSVKDKGEALSPEEAVLCCEKFWRGTNSKGKTGSGLGLYISSYFCVQMGGKLEISQDKGFCAKIYLPMP